MKRSPWWRIDAAILALACSALSACASIAEEAPVDDERAVNAAPSDAAPSEASPHEAPASAAAPSALVVARPYTLHVPRGLDTARPAPLVVSLHGFTGNAALQLLYFGLKADADEHGYLVAAPDGLADAQGRHYWNATDACCDFERSGVDDVAYLRAVIDDVSARHNVDPRRIYLVGHSNGGFMAHRFACDVSDRVAAIVSLAGGQWLDPALCAPSSAVSVLQVHGTRDTTIPYDGQGAYPSAHATVAVWAAKNGCSGALESAGASLDLVPSLAGEETRRERYASCPAGGDVELWTIDEAGHIPLFSSAWADALWRFLEAHPKP